MTAQPGVAVTTTAAAGPPEFSLVLGGPVFRLCRRSHLSGATLERLGRRVVVITLFAWVPLLLLSVFEGYALGGAIKVPFLQDIEANARFLVALPVLIIAELVVHRRISPLIRKFVDRRIVVTEDLPRFEAAINSALRARNSIAIEATLPVPRAMLTTMAIAHTRTPSAAARVARKIPAVMRCNFSPNLRSIS